MATIMDKTAADKEMGSNVEESRGGFAGEQLDFSCNEAKHSATAHEVAENGHAATDK